MTETEWRRIVTDPSEERIFEALDDPKWEWRTISALARASGRKPDEVRAILARYPTLVRKSTVRGADGDELFTLQRRYFERMGVLAKVWASLSSSSS
jgi:hypothetical protein